MVGQKKVIVKTLQLSVAFSAGSAIQGPRARRRSGAARRVRSLCAAHMLYLVGARGQATAASGMQSERLTYRNTAVTDSGSLSLAAHEDAHSDTYATGVACIPPRFRLHSQIRKQPTFT